MNDNSNNKINKSNVDKDSFCLNNLDDNGNVTLDFSPLKFINYKISIKDLFISGNILLSFTNHGNNNISIEYIFPLSTHAVIYDMNIDYNGAKLILKDFYNRKNYNNFPIIKVSQLKPNVLKIEINSLEVGKELIIQILFFELLLKNQNSFEYVLPTVVAPRYSNKVNYYNSDNDGFLENSNINTKQTIPYSFSYEILIDSYSPIYDILCLSHFPEIKYINDTSVIISGSKTDEFVGNRDIIVRFKYKKSFNNYLLKYNNQSDNLNYFLINYDLLATKKFNDIDLTEYIFILDISNSMSGIPISIATKFLQNVISNNRSIDKFNIILFSDDVHGTLFNRSIFFSDENNKTAICFINSIKTGGGTNVQIPAINAFQLRKPLGYSRCYVIITDGLIANEDEAILAFKNKIALDCIVVVGVGLSTNRYLIESLSKIGNGYSFVIPVLALAESYAEEFINTKIKRQYEYTLLKNKNKDLKHIIVNNVLSHSSYIIGVDEDSLPDKTTVIVNNKDHSDESKIEINNISSTDSDLSILPYIYALYSYKKAINNNDMNLVEQLKNISKNFKILNSYNPYTLNLINNEDNESIQPNIVKIQIPIPYDLLDKDSNVNTYIPDSLIIDNENKSLEISPLKKKRKLFQMLTPYELQIKRKFIFQYTIADNFISKELNDKFSEFMRLIKPMMLQLTEDKLNYNDSIFFQFSVLNSKASHLTIYNEQHNADFKDLIENCLEKVDFNIKSDHEIFIICVIDIE